MTAEGAIRADGRTNLALHVDGAEWRFVIESVKRIGRELFIQIGLQGPDVCSMTVHVRDRIVFGVTSAQILNLACEWLLTRGSAKHAYLDLAESGTNWMAAGAA